MEEEKKEVEVKEEQPKKKKSHKGAIIAWSIIGSLVLITGGAMLLLLNNMKNNAATAKIQGKTFEADTSEAFIRVYDGIYEADEETGKKVLAFVKTKSESDAEAKEIQDCIDKYGATAYTSKFTGTKIEVSGTSLFSYSMVDVTLKGSDGSDWYRYSLEVDSSKQSSLKKHLNGDEKEQETKLYTKTGIPGGVVQVLNTTKTTPVDLYPAYGAYRCQFGTATYNSKTYSIRFEVNYYDNK